MQLPEFSTSPFADHRDTAAFFFPGEQFLRALEFMGAVLWTQAHVGVLTADEGGGKSILIRHFLKVLDERVLCASVHSQEVTASEFLNDVLKQFGVVLEDRDRTNRRRLLKQFLTHQLTLGRTCLVIVENPQTMPPLVLDEIKALADIRVEGNRLLKLLLVGQPLLNHVVDSPRMGDLMRSGATRFALASLSEDQVGAYVAHRLRAAGAADPDEVMPYTLMTKIYQYSAGSPLLVNQICTQALACAAAAGASAVTAVALDQAIAALKLEPRVSPGVLASAGRDKPLSAANLVVAMQGVPDREVPLRRTRILIGRGDLADVRIDSVFVSRYHALVVREPAHDLLIDLGSTNGVLVNSKRAMRHVLRHRDLVQIGPARVTYLNAAAAGPMAVDPSQTLCFARAGGPADGEAGSGTVLGFGRAADNPNG